MNGQPQPESAINKRKDEAELAAALRANLAKRKAQQRAREATAPESTQA